MLKWTIIVEEMYAKKGEINSTDTRRNFDIKKL